MSSEYLVSTGTLIKEYLNEQKINQNTLAKRTGMSEKHISNVLNGNCRLTEEFVIKLEKVLTDVKASYWLGYEAKYREYIARQEEKLDLQNSDLKDISKRFRFKEVFQGLNLSLVEQAVEMLRLLKISNFNQFEEAYEYSGVSFMEDGGEKEAIAIWLNLCESEVEIQNNDLRETHFDREKLKQSLSKFKMLSNNANTEMSLLSCRKLCNMLGIYFVTCEAITNCKVRGALTTYKGHPAIFISGRFKTHPHIWFALMHELAHLILHYNAKEILISMDDENTVDSKEVEANEFARNIFIVKEEYRKFVESESFTKDSISVFAKKQKTLPCFVVDFLKHDGKLEYSQFTYL